jgi:hypothetical protein
VQEEHIGENYLKQKIGFDVDGVLANWVQAFLDYAHKVTSKFGMTHNLPHQAVNITTWNLNGHDELIKLLFPVLAQDQQFWMSIRRYDEACRVMFEKQIKPAAYITQRPIPSELTATWLKRNFFPPAPVFTVDKAEDKQLLVKNLGLTHFVEDRSDTADQMHDLGLTSYLLNRPYNVNWPTKAIRIMSIGEIELEQLADSEPDVRTAAE